MQIRSVRWPSAPNYYYYKPYQRENVKKEVVHSSGAPSSPLYSQAVKAGNSICLSGFTGMNSGTKQLSGETIEEQTNQAIRNCESVLRAAGSGLGDVVQVIILLSSPDDFEGMNGEYAKFFPRNPPARMVAKLGVSLSKVKISIAMTAFTSHDSC